MGAQHTHPVRHLLCLLIGHHLAAVQHGAYGYTVCLRCGRQRP